MTREEIKEYVNGMLEKMKKCTAVSLISRNKKYIKIKKIILSETTYLPEESNMGERIYQILNNLYERPKCLECCVNFVRYNTGRYSKYCCSKCSGKNKNVQEKLKQTNLKRRGVKYNTQCSECREKFKKTCLEKYGVENPMQNKKIQEKTQKTCREKYGYDYANQSPIVKRNIKNSCKEKYGVENIFQDKIYQMDKKRKMKKYIGVFLEKISLKMMGNYDTQLNPIGFMCLKCDKEFEST